jgi:hypothetical protein
MIVLCGFVMFVCDGCFDFLQCGCSIFVSVGMTEAVDCFHGFEGCACISLVICGVWHV